MDQLRERRRTEDLPRVRRLRHLERGREEAEVGEAADRLVGIYGTGRSSDSVCVSFKSAPKVATVSG